MADSPRRRSKSRSPPRRAAKGGGFRWKGKRSSNNDNADERDRGLDRGYRNRSPRRDRNRDRSRDGGRDEGRDRDRGQDRDRDRERRPQREGDRDRDRPRDKDSDRSSQPSSSKPQAAKAESGGGSRKNGPAPTLIVVHVNDRLGTKAAIPCLASDTILQFKVMVAARIGRGVNEIMIKRQGERPFKDVLTLEDYGVGNGVQLDLELDTGD